MGKGKVVNLGHVLSVERFVLSVGGLVLAVASFYLVSPASAVFVFLCCIPVLVAFGAEDTPASVEVRKLRSFGAPL